MYLQKGAIVLANTKLYSKQNHCSKLPRPIDISIFAENHNLHVPIYFGSEGASMFAGNDFFQRITRIPHQVVLTPELHYRQCHPLHRQEPRFSILLDMGNNFEDIDILNLSTP